MKTFLDMRIGVEIDATDTNFMCGVNVALYRALFQFIYAFWLLQLIIQKIQNLSGHLLRADQKNSFFMHCS